MVALLNGAWRPAFYLLASLQGVKRDVLSTLHHQLQHETAHLAPLSVFCGVVVQDGDIGGSLDKTVKIVGIDADLVFHGGQLIGLANAVGNERTVVDTLGHVAFVTREQ